MSMVTHNEVYSVILLSLLIIMNVDKINLCFKLLFDKFNKTFTLIQILFIKPQNAIASIMMPRIGIDFRNT